MFDVNNFEAIKIDLVSPEKIKEWAYGEVKKPETINYRTLKPERDGLFCEKIFGPIRDWECHCGKYKRIRFKGVICDKCGVEVTHSKVRRERMGYIELASPVCHIWYFKGIPSRIGLLLNLSPRALEKIIYFASYIVVDAGNTTLTKMQLMSEMEYRDYKEKYGNAFKASIGAEAIKQLLGEIDLESLKQELRDEIRSSIGQKRNKTIKRLEVVDAFLRSSNRPEWMVLDVLPVIPPELRPMVQLDGGRFATSDLNDLYRRVINRNNRLRRLLDLNAPEIIVKNEKRMLQEAVDALIDNSRRNRPVTGSNNRPLKSLSDVLKGKQGRFRQNLLGKRVDYSGRSVIVVGPKLKLHQCGLPKEMALELFKPFVMKKLVEYGLVHNIKSAKRMVERVKPEVWDILEEVIKEHPVLLNRAPTLHRLGIQAFEPVLVEGKAIQIHPLVCTPYNADFDGDQMAVHLPLSVSAQSEARLLMLSSNNVLLPAYGNPVTVPTQDMVLGIYYLTIEKKGAKGEGKYFSSVDEAVMAYETDAISLQALIKIPRYCIDKSVKPAKKYSKDYAETTVGRIIFNRAFPEDIKLRFFNEMIGKKGLSNIIAECHRKYGSTKTAILLDLMKDLGFKYASISGITISVADIHIPKDKQEILKATDTEVNKIENYYQMGFLTNKERYEKVIAEWNAATEKVAGSMLQQFDRLNSVYMMAHSGARGNVSQVKQIAGMRGLMADPSGKILEEPIRANLREGLTVLEYFISTHGARKGLADTALRTADSGYLTRRLIDVAQDVIVRDNDCGTFDTVEIEAILEGDEEVEPLWERITGRFSGEDITDRETGEIIIKKNELIEEEAAHMISKQYEKIRVRTPFNCQTRHGICVKCYGRNLATGKVVSIGETVGVIAAQSIGEPGTQLTLRTFHTGGVAQEDIIQGLPRVEELFEARKPKNAGHLSEISGVIRLGEEKGMRKITIQGGEQERTYSSPIGVRVKVSNEHLVSPGDQLTEGPLNPHDILLYKGLQSVQRYLVTEVQKVYRSQGVDINDRHIEVIVRQMTKKVKIDDPGDTDFLPGGMKDLFEVQEANEVMTSQGKKTCSYHPVLLGVTKASLATDSFLSSASFQETTRVLTTAAIEGKTDYLLGLKENVIIGKLIPAGTGMFKQKNIEVSPRITAS